MAKIHADWTAALCLAPIYSILAHEHVLSDLKTHYEIQHNYPLLQHHQEALLWLNLGLLHGFLGEYKWAEGFFKHALKLDEGNVLGWYALGIVRFMYGDLKNSISATRRCLACFGRSIVLDVKLGKCTGWWKNVETELEGGFRNNGLWKLEKRRVEWNLSHTVYERRWKKEGIPRPREGKCGLNGIPAGVLFGPGFVVDGQVIVQSMVDLGMLPNRFTTAQDLQRETEKVRQEELQKAKRKLSNIHPLFGPKPPLLLRLRRQPTSKLKVIPEDTDPILTRPSFPVVRRMDPSPESSASRFRPTKPMTPYSTRTSSLAIPQLPQGPSHHLCPPSELLTSQHRSRKITFADSVNTLSEVLKQEHHFLVREGYPWRTLPQDFEKAESYDQASIRPESSISQQLLLPFADPPPIPPRSYKIMTTTNTNASVLDVPRSSKLQQASFNLNIPPPNPLLSQQDLENAKVGGYVHISATRSSESIQNGLLSDIEQTLQSQQVSSTHHHAPTSPPSKQQPKEAEMYNVSPILPVISKQDGGTGPSEITNYPSWWSPSKKELDRLNTTMYENVSRLDADAGRPKRVSAYRIPPRSDSLRSPATPTTPAYSTAKAAKPDPFAHLLPFGYNRTSQVADERSSSDPTSAPTFGTRGHDQNANSTGGSSNLNPVTAPTYSSYDHYVNSGCTPPSKSIITSSENIQESTQTPSRPAGPSFPAPDLKKLRSPLSPTTASNPPAKPLPPPPPPPKKTTPPRNRKALHLPTLLPSTNAPTLISKSPFHRPSNSISVETSDLTNANDSVVRYYFSSKFRESNNELEDLFARHGGVILGKNVMENLREAQMHQLNRKTEEQRRVERELKARLRAKEKEEEGEPVEGLSSKGLLRPVVFSGVGRKYNADSRLEGEVSRDSSALLRPPSFSGFDGQYERDSILRNSDDIQPLSSYFGEQHEENPRLDDSDLLRPTVFSGFKKKTKVKKDNWTINEEGDVV